MWQIEGPSADVPDLAHFVATVHDHAEFFDGAAPIVVARAPGRLDVMGGIADYSGSLVLELPLAAATFVAAQATSDDYVTIRSLSALGASANPEFTIALEALAPRGIPLEYAAARSLLGRDARTRWAAYVVGIVLVLARERRAALRRGLRLLVDSTVPLGKGVSSSAALEVAAMSAVCGVYGVSLGGRDLALLCQMVENLVVGAPCGVMDQMTAACGEKDRLLAVLCQPAELRDSVELPPSLAIWGIDSGIRHDVSAADYGDVRVGAFMGYRIVAEAAGLASTVRPSGHVQVDDSRWHGYLANVTPSEWEATYRAHVPEALDGAAFLDRFGGITDSVTSVQRTRTYAVRQPTAHPIYEHHRVRLFRALLEAGAATEEQRLLLGELMYQSHTSYSGCGLGSGGTDRLVSLVHDQGAPKGLYGAKITGGGSGGVVAVLGSRDSLPAVEAVARDYECLTGRTALILGGSSDGATRFGVIRLRS